VPTSGLPPQRPARTTSRVIVKRTWAMSWAAASRPPPAPPSPLVADDPFPWSNLPYQGGWWPATAQFNSSGERAVLPSSNSPQPDADGRASCLPLARDVPCLAGIDPRRLHVQCFIPSWVGIIREGLQKTEISGEILSPVRAIGSEMIAI
jgi:hypothetical protein